MPSAPTVDCDDLRRTRQYLAEVIDECVFVERQRELTERRLSSQLSTHKNLIDELVSALRHVCRYTSVMEDAILPTLLDSSRASAAARLRLIGLRGGIRDVLMSLSGVIGGDKEVNVLFPSEPQISSCARTAGASAMLADNAVEAGGEVLERLFAREAILVDALAMATARLKVTSAVFPTGNSDSEGLHPDPDELGRRFQRSNSVSLESATQISASATPMAAVQTPHVVATSGTRFNEARAMAYEKTIQALNIELALLQENYAALSRASARELDTLKQKIDDNECKHKNHIAECDAVLGRISLELEQLIHENAQLKHKLLAATDVE